jgi:RNA polymerase sigma factor (sigma-70 family)
MHQSLLPYPNNESWLIFQSIKSYGTKTAFIYSVNKTCCTNSITTEQKIFNPCVMSSLTSLTHSQIAQLFQEHEKALSQFLTYRVRCPETAQDLCQETYLRLLRENAVTHDENICGFLFRIADRLAINYLKWQKLPRNCGIPLDENLVCTNRQPDELTALRQQCDRLLHAINSLPRKYRDVFLLRKIDELSYTDIARKLAISEKTVQRHLVKAMLHCHQLMEISNKQAS